MKKIIYFLYNNLPSSAITAIGRLSFLSSIRNRFLRDEKGRARLLKVNVKRKYLDYLLSFFFTANIKTASKAKKYGIENTLIRSSLKLLVVLD